MSQEPQKDIITITIKNLPNGQVEIQSNPSFALMAQMVESGHDLTSAHGYAMAVLNVIREIGKQKDQSTLVKIPRISKKSSHI